MHISNAGVAQLVERNLAKVEVESSRLFSRSKSSSHSGELGPVFLVDVIGSVSCRLVNVMRE